MMSKINCDELAKSYGVSDEAIAQMRKEIDDGAPIEEVFKNRKTRLQKAYDNNPQTFKKAKEIQDKIEKGDVNAFKTISYHLVPEHGKGNTFLNVESTQKSIMDSILYKHHDSLNKLRNKLFGNKPKKDLLARMVKQMFGEINDVEAKQTLSEFNTINNASYDLYKRSGGLDNQYQIGLQNNQERILQDDFATFYTNTKDLVTNSEADLKALYNKAKIGDDISDDILDFTNSDNYLQYAGQYGSDMWSSFMNQLQKQANATAMNKVFGPNSKSAIEKLIKDNKLNKAEQERVEALVNALNGSLNNVMRGGEHLSKYAKGARSLAAASMLGGAVLSAVADFATVFQTARFNNLPAMKTMMKGLQGLYKIEDNKQLLAQLGFITDDLIDGLRNASRFDPNAAGTDMLSMAADKVLRGSGLMAWTTSQKNTWKLSHLAHMANMTKQYKTIPKKMKHQMSKYGITQQDWNVIRKQGGEFMDVTTLPDDLSYKMRQYVTEESNYAVLEPGASNQAYMSLGTQAGTVKGELARSATQFKSFMVAGILTHLSRIWKLDTNMDQASYTLTLGMVGMVIGSLVLGLKDMKNGNDPTTRDFDALKSLEASGVFGPLGELLTPSKYGESKFDMVSLGSAPIISLVSKPVRAITSDKDFDEKVGDTLRALGQSMPGQNLLPTAWATDLIGRNMLLLVNPDYQKRFDQIDRAKNARESKDGLEPMDMF
jgi:hypothetical protein